MRVTHIITRLIVGGAQENTVSSVLGLQRKPGLEIDLISGPTTGPEGSLESAFAHQPNSLRLARHLIRAVHPLHDWLALRELTQMLRVRRPDIVHTHSSKAGILGRLRRSAPESPSSSTLSTARRSAPSKARSPTSFSPLPSATPPAAPRTSSPSPTR